MWTPEDRVLVGDFGSGQALSDDQYRLIEPFIPPPKPGGRPRTTDMRQMLDGLFYVVRTGCQWRHLPPPPAFPPWQTVYGYFRAFLEAGVWETIRHSLVMTLRETEGREASPTAVIIDTQSVKTTEAGGPRGFDMAKKVKGRKRHIVTDTEGSLLIVRVHAANVQDSHGAVPLLRAIGRVFPMLRHIFADRVYRGPQLLTALADLGQWTIEIITRTESAGTFKAEPRRWVVERTFAWLGRNRRLAKDFEATIASAVAWIYIASVRLLSRRLARA